MIVDRINSFYRMNHFVDASPRFLEDSMLKDDRAVVPRSPDLHCTEIGGPLKVTVLGHACSALSYSSPFKLPSPFVHRFVVMDGSHGVFKVHLNILTSKTLNDKIIPKGSTIVINTWNWIWLEQPNSADIPATSHGVLIAHDYYFRLSLEDPAWGYDCSTCRGPEERTITEVDCGAVEFVGNTSYLTWLTPNKDRVMSIMTHRGIRKGLFIPDLGDRKKFLDDREHHDWLDYYYCQEENINESQPKCSCFADFGIVPCVCEQYPTAMAHQQRSYIFEMVGKFLPDYYLVPSFDHLPPSKQRGCMLWYYSIQIFQIKGPNQKSLPTCFLDQIRTRYPNPKHDFFLGFKIAEQEQVEDLRKRANLEAELCNEFVYHQDQNILPSRLMIPSQVIKSVMEVGGAIGDLSNKVAVCRSVTGLSQNRRVLFLSVHVLLDRVISTTSILGLDLAVLVQKKILVNEKKYPIHLCQMETETKKYTCYSSVTGIERDSDVPLGLEINPVRPDANHLSLTIHHQSNMDRFQRLLLDLQHRVTDFSKVRGWLRNYDLHTLVCSLFSEMGELVELIQWKDKSSLKTYNDVREGLARELADITIYSLHMLRELNQV